MSNTGFAKRSHYLHGNRKALQRQAKLHRLKAKGLLPTKDDMRQLVAQAIAAGKITKIEPQPTSATPQQHKPKLTRFKRYAAMR